MVDTLAWHSHVLEVVRDDDSAAKAHLEVRRPIYYREPGMPAGLVIREDPDGSRELIGVTAAGDEISVTPRSTSEQEIPPR